VALQKSAQVRTAAFERTYHRHSRRRSSTAGQGPGKRSDDRGCRQKSVPGETVRGRSADAAGSKATAAREVPSFSLSPLIAPPPLGSVSAGALGPSAVITDAGSRVVKHQ